MIPNQQQAYPPNGSTQVVVSQPGSPIEVLARLGLTEPAQQELVEAFRRAAKQAVDDVVAGRQEPAKAAYFIARRLDGDAWWKR
jgi:hypothetical protein